VILKGWRRGEPLSPAGLDSIMEDARERAGRARLTSRAVRHRDERDRRGQGDPVAGSNDVKAPAIDRPVQEAAEIRRRLAAAFEPDLASALNSLGLELWACPLVPRSQKPPTDQTIAWRTPKPLP
jgi:hypothetical protein